MSARAFEKWCETHPKTLNAVVWPAILLFLWSMGAFERKPRSMFYPDPEVMAIMRAGGQPPRMTPAIPSCSEMYWNFTVVQPDWTASDISGVILNYQRRGTCE